MIKLDNRNIKNFKIVETGNLLGTCSCSSKHVPNPMKLIEISHEGSVWVVCPTFLVNLIDLLEEYDLHNGVVPGRVTKHYGKAVRDLAKTLWAPP